MASDLPLALLETAPDRETAEIMLVSALHSGASPEQLREAWNRWEQSWEQAYKRGETW